MTAVTDPRTAIDLNSPSADHDEMEAFLRWLLGRGERYQVVLEIGAHRGGSARVWRDALRPDLLVTVDQQDLLGADREGIQIVVGRSQDHDVVRGVYDLLAGRDVDLLYIDGGHYLEEVVLDWAHYAPAVRRGGGVVGLHDVAAPATNEVAVAEVWRWAREESGREWRLFHGAGTGIGATVL